MKSRGPVGTLFLASGCSAVVVALVHALFATATAPFGLLRNLELFSAVFGSPGAPRLQVGGPFGVGIETMLARPFPLHSTAAVLVFVAVVLAATLALYWTVAALAAPVVVALVSLSPESATPWLWRRAFPLGVLVSSASPCLLIPVHGALRGHGAAVILESTIVITVVVWLALVAIVRNVASLGRFVRRAAFGSAIFAGLIWSGALISVAMGTQTLQSPASAGAPNILLVSIDSLRRDHVHCYGYGPETSPTIDALAREGVMFRTVASPTSWTLPAHLTLLTSLPPEVHGVVRDGSGLTERALFLAEVLWQAGYTTAGFVSAPYLDSAYGFSQGFDHYDDYTIAKRSFDESEHVITSPTLVRIVSNWLHDWDGGGRARPFFIFMHMWDVHYDYTPPPPYDKMFDPDYHGTVTGENYWYGTQVHEGMDPRDLQHIIALYDGEIRFTDLHLGYVLDELRKLDVLDHTIIVVTADHGDEFFEHGRKGHKQALYDESILVPLVIRFPATVPAGRVVGNQVRLMDIAPTIIALAGLPLPSDFGPTDVRGTQAPQSLLPWITADSTAALPALPAFSDLVGDAPVPIAAIRTGAAKFIQEQRSRGKEELYDLRNDPGEQTDLLLRDGHSAGTPLREQLTSWRRVCAGSTGLVRPAVLSEAHKERLRALGYLK